MRLRQTRRFAVGAMAAALVAGAVASAPVEAGGRRAAQPPPWVVSVGDSYISGEAGRWAGNTNLSPTMTDAGGPGAYSDAGAGESIARCHRSTSAEIHIGVAQSLNLACSGARTTTSTTSDGFFKPGLDFYSDASGRKGQALLLQEFAASHDVRMIQVSIGGNNFGFADVVTQCLIRFTTSTPLSPDYCHDDPSVMAYFAPDRVAAVTAEITTALGNIVTAMSNAGYTPDRYTIMVQTYPSPLPAGADIRYGETLAERHTVGGCEFWNADADWANQVAAPTINNAVRNAAAAAAAGGANVKVLDITNAFAGRRLCERGVGTLEEQGLLSWTAPGAVDKTEWVQRIRVETGIAGTPYFIQESFHPNWWGQLALRNCVRQAYNNGAPQGGTCTRLDGLNAGNEPNMRFEMSPPPPPPPTTAPIPTVGPELPEVK